MPLFPSRCVKGVHMDPRKQPLVGTDGGGLALPEFAGCGEGAENTDGLQPSSSRPENSCVERLCRKDSAFSSPAVKSVKNRTDIKWFYNLLHLLASLLLGHGPAQTGERQESHGLKILWQFK